VEGAIVHPYQGRRKKEEGRRKKEEGRRKKEEGRRQNVNIFNHCLFVTFKHP
jgi:tRNA nucleotidyltransferase (CCA-adding enzyme)